MVNINKEEYWFLNGLNDGWKWIAKDKNTSLWVYEKEPRKHEDCWDEFMGTCEMIDSPLFQFIQWEDEEPYNIAWLLGEYEEAEYGYFNNELYERFYDESVETEVKDSEPMMNYVNREIEMIKETLPHMDRVESEGRKEWHEGFLSALENVRDKFNQLEEPEVLSQELPVVPKFVADWIEGNKQFEEKWNDYSKEDAMNDTIHFTIYGLFADYPATNSHVELRKPVLKWLSVDRGNYFKLVNAVRYGYEVENPKYYALIKGHELIQGEEKYWNYDKENGTLEVGRNRVQDDVLTNYTIQATLSEWEDLGINEDNAEFVKVNE